MAWNLHPFCFEKLDEVLKDSLVLPLSSCRLEFFITFWSEKLDEGLKDSLVLSPIVVVDLLSFLLLISMAWNLHPLYFEKLDEVLKDSLVLPLSSCRAIKFLVLFRIGWKLETNLFFSSVQPKMLFFALHLNHDTAESTRNLHPFCFEKLDEVLKDSLVRSNLRCCSLPLYLNHVPAEYRPEGLLDTLWYAICLFQRTVLIAHLNVPYCEWGHLGTLSIQPKMLLFALHLNHDTAESTRVVGNIWHAIRLVPSVF
ncbi:hypothetical protein Tco_0315659 [Tanacetum coccineum]